MEKEDLIKKLELSNNKLSIFADTKEIEKYDLDEVTLINLINRFLTDNEKTKLFEFEYFKKAPANVIRDIVYSISEDKLITADPWCAGSYSGCEETFGKNREN